MEDISAKTVPQEPDSREARSMLKRLAMAHGAETPIGRACHNLLEMTENYAKSSDQTQRTLLRANIEREMTRLAVLRAGVSH